MHANTENLGVVVVVLLFIPQRENGTLIHKYCGDCTPAAWRGLRKRFYFLCFLDGSTILLPNGGRIIL